MNTSFITAQSIPSAPISPPPPPPTPWRERHGFLPRLFRSLKLPLPLKRPVLKFPICRVVGSSSGVFVIKGLPSLAAYLSLLNFTFSGTYNEQNLWQIKNTYWYMLVIERFYNPVLLVSLSPNQPAVEKRLRLAWRKKPNFCSRCPNVFFFGEETSGGVAKCRQGFLKLGCDRIWKVLRSTEKTFSITAN